MFEFICVFVTILLVFGIVAATRWSLRYAARSQENATRVNIFWSVIFIAAAVAFILYHAK